MGTSPVILAKLKPTVSPTTGESGREANLSHLSKTLAVSSRIAGQMFNQQTNNPVPLKQSQLCP